MIRKACVVIYVNIYKRQRKRRFVSTITNRPTVIHSVEIPTMDEPHLDVANAVDLYIQRNLVAAGAGQIYPLFTYVYLDLRKGNYNLKETN